MVSISMARIDSQTDQVRANARGRLSVQQSEELAQCMLNTSVVGRFEVGALIMSTFQTGTASRAIDKLAQGPGVWAKTLGAYVHGGVLGVTSEVKLRPKLVQLCNKLVGEHALRYGNLSWTALRLSCDNALEEHVDRHKCPHSRTFVVPLSMFEGGRILVQGFPRDFGSPPCACIHPRFPHSVEAATGIRLVLIAYMPRNGERLPMQDKLLLCSLGFPLPPYMSLPNPVGSGQQFPLLAVDSTQVGAGLQPKPHAAKERICSCTPAHTWADPQPCLPLHCRILLADVSRSPCNPRVQCFLTCIANPMHCHLEEDGAHLQSQLLLHRQFLREIVRQKCPKLQCLGRSAGHASKAESVSERKAKGRLESESAEERRKLCAIGSCRMLAKHVRSQDNQKSCEMISKHDVSGEPSGSGEMINGLQEEMFGMWAEAWAWTHSAYNSGFRRVSQTGQR